MLVKAKSSIHNAVRFCENLFNHLIKFDSNSGHFEEKYARLKN